MQPIAVRGRWWLPEEPDDKQAGTFTLDAERCDLILDQSFSMRAADETNKSGVVAYNDIFKVVLEPVVHGVDDQGQTYSLLDCTTHRPAISGEVSNTRNGVHAAVIGAHLSGTSMTFDKAKITYSHLLDWTGWLGLQMTRSVEGSEILFALTAGTKRHRAYCLPDAIVYLEERRRSAQEARKFSVEQEAQLSVELSTPEDWFQLAQKYIVPLNDFVSFATLTATAFEEVLVHVQGEPAEAMYPLLFRSVHMRRKAVPRRRHPMDMLFTLGDASEFNGLLGSWYAFNDTYKSVVQQLLAGQYAPFEWAENSFLGACRAADAFTRRKFKEQPYTKDEISHLVAVVADNVEDTELQDFAIRVIKGNNHLSQQEQLKRLLEYSGPVGSDVSTAMPNFVKEVSAIRNGLTHPNSKGNPGAVYRYRVEQGLRWALRACILKELGFGDDRIRDLIDRSVSYRFDMGELANVESLKVKEQ